MPPIRTVFLQSYCTNPIRLNDNRFLEEYITQPGKWIRRNSISKETAKKLISELQTNEELRAKIEGITVPAELTKKTVEAGYDVTLDELLEAEK